MHTTTGVSGYLRCRIYKAFASLLAVLAVILILTGMLILYEAGSLFQARVGIVFIALAMVDVGVIFYLRDTRRI